MAILPHQTTFFLAMLGAGRYIKLFITINIMATAIKTSAFTVNSKDLFNNKKNPTLSLSVKDILRNKKIKKQFIELPK